MFGWGLKNRTVKELRKNQGLTAREAAIKLKVDTVDVLKVDNLKLKDVPEPLRSRLTPLLRGDYMNKIPW
ncbi:MAG: hypothetical protein QMC81_09595 [Thermoanaerobacterales bacterium]|nr:transcriptional regulator [Bacillota bacterium]MDI6907716.1 hypothetical protein [Thermoanaerobacterales bacterium]